MLDGVYASAFKCHAARGAYLLMTQIQILCKAVLHNAYDRVPRYEIALASSKTLASTATRLLWYIKRLKSYLINQ